ncbi:MAG: hypothetical protein ABJG88_03405 [Litorimonas sp.]
MTMWGDVQSSRKIYRGIRLGFGYVAFLLSVMVPQICFAGAWNLPKNEGQVIVTGVFSGGNTIFDDDGMRQAANFSKTETRVFFEHGVTDRWTLTANGAFQMSQFQSEGFGLGGAFNFDDFDDTEFGLRYQLKRKQGLAVSVQASYVLDGGPPDNILDIGGSRDTVELRALWGQSFENEKWGEVFFDAQLAGRLRVDNGKYDSTRADLTFGYKPVPKWFVFIQNFGTLREAETSLGFTVSEQVQFKSNVSVGYEYKRNRFIQIGYSETLFGRNIVKERGAFLSTWVRY